MRLVGRLSLPEKMAPPPSAAQILSGMGVMPASETAMAPPVEEQIVSQLAVKSAMENRRR